MITTHVRDRRRDSIAPAVLRVPGTLAKWPLIGLFMFLSGGLLFGALAYNLEIHGPLLKWDVPTANYLHRVALSSSSYVKTLMIAGFYVGKQVITVIGIMLSLYYLFKRFWRELAMVLIGFGGAGILWFLLSNLFNRPRPIFDPPIWIVIKGGGFQVAIPLPQWFAMGFSPTF